MNIKQYLSKIGRKGGKAGTGKSKRRGNAAYYKNLVKIRENKKAKKIEE